MKYLLGIDCETTGLDENKGNLIEIGMAIFHVPTRSILANYSSVIHANDNPVSHINNIEQHHLDAVKDKPFYYYSLVQSWFADCDAVIAHNADFDKRWVNKHLHLSSKRFTDKKWICTRHHIKWPNSPNLKLETIASVMDVKYHNAHRALSDVHIMFNCLKKLPDLDKQLERLK